LKSDACSSITREISIDARFDVMPEISASSAATASGAVCCQRSPCFAAAVVSPFSDLTVSRSILSDWTSAKTFSCFFSSAGGFFES
jgi:hypothetical protein